jgi:hypothetical protein
MYKLFMKILTKRLTPKLDFYQPKEQAGFRRGYGTNDHLHTIKILIEKCIEYNIPLVLAFVDYEKAFDTVEFETVLEALNQSRIDYRYTSLIKNIYENATSSIRLHEDTEKFSLGRGVRQGDNISPKLFTAALESIFKNTQWQDMGINIDGERLNHLRFADDVVLIADNLQDTVSMLHSLKSLSERAGLKINFEKTKLMTNLVMSGNITIDNNTIQQTDTYKYLGHEIKINRDNQTNEIQRRIGLTWAAFGKLSHILKSSIPMCLKRKVYNQCVLPVQTYGAETLTLTQKSANKLRVTQRAMERAMLNVSLRDHITNRQIRQRSGVQDVIERTTRLKWNWAGHLARTQDGRWTRRIMEWRPRNYKRSRGRPPTRWTDDIKRVAGNWLQAAQCREHWKELREAYVQQWTGLAD